MTFFIYRKRKQQMYEYLSIGISAHSDNIISYVSKRELNRNNNKFKKKPN